MIEMVQIALLKRPVISTEQKHSHHSHNFISANRNQPRTRPNEKSPQSIQYGKILTTSHWLIQLTKN